MKILNQELQTRLPSAITGHLIPAKTDYMLENPYIDCILDSINNNENVLLIGEPGCGKSALVLHLAAELGIPLVQIQGDGECSVTDLIGGFQFNNGETKWIDGLIPFALNNYCWILFDEINMVLPEILSRLHSMLDNRRMLDLHEIGKSIVVSRETIIFGTMNESESGRHAGTKPLSPALRSRMHSKVKFSYLTPSSEIKLLTQRTGINIKDASLLVRLANQIRDAWRKGEVNDPIDTRALLACAYKINRGFKVEHAIYPTILNDLSEDTAQAAKGLLISYGVIKPEEKK